MNNIPSELYTSIFNYLRPIDLHMIARVDNKRKNITNYEITSRFENWNRLRTFFKNPKKFLSLFNKNCILSGSIILQFLLNESYNGDIDVYLTESEYHNFKDFLTSENFSFVSSESEYDPDSELESESESDSESDTDSESSSESDSEYEGSSESDSEYEGSSQNDSPQYDPPQYREEDTMSGGNYSDYRDTTDTLSDTSSDSDDPFANYNDLSPTSEYFRVETFSRDCLPNKENYTTCNVQLIITNDPLKSIRDFDFDIVKNYYNGENLYFNKNIINKTEIISIDKIFTLPTKQQERMKKYISRGFKFLIQ
jgi:hypothetical protein